MRSPPRISRPNLLPLKLAGVAPFRAALEEKLLEAGFEVGPPPDLSIVTFRYLPGRGDPNEFNRRLVDAVQRDGRIFISSTIIDGKFTLRLVVSSLRTHLETVDLTIEILRENAKQLERNV